jgi:hypothetical protein
LPLQKHEAEYRHSVRVANAQNRWPEAVRKFEEDFCRQAVVEINGAS